MSSFLHVRGLFKSFQSGHELLKVLQGVEFQLEAGRTLAVTGASGSGKSTLLHLLGGMDRPDAGEIRVEGRNIVELEGVELARFRNREVGFVFQFHHLLPEFTALENVMFPLLLRRVAGPVAAEKALALLREVGLETRNSHRPGELSGGEQQRVAIARALAGRPGLLLADEPTGNLDQHTAETVAKVLLEMQRRYALTGIIVTHNPRLAALCDEERRMSEGLLVEVPPSDRAI